jgi:hypothetical protein
MVEMFPVAEKLLEDHRFEPVFFIFRDLPERFHDQLAGTGIRKIGPKANSAPSGGGEHQALESSEAGGGGRSRLQKTTKSMVKFALSWTLISFVWYLVKLWRQLRRSRTIIWVEDVAGVVVMGDRHVGWETCLVKAANERHLPTLIVPFGLSDPKSDVEMRLRLPDSQSCQVSTLLDKLVSRSFPTWIRSSGDQPLFFLPPGNALAARALGVMPDNPWTLGGGAARRMAVESPVVFRSFLDRGVPEGKMVVTGKPSMDQIYRRLRTLNETDLRSEFGIPEDQRIILCSVPQLGEHGLLSWDEHWQEIEFLFATLTGQSGAAVILSLHPSSNPSDYRPLVEKYGAVLAERRIYELIPHCDILVATYSSVVAQAIGGGKPVIVVDFYGLDYTYYDGEPGVKVIKEHADLAPALNHLVTDRGYYDEMSAAQSKRGPEWVLLDGRCTHRVVQELYQMVGAEVVS